MIGDYIAAEPSRERWLLSYADLLTLLLAFFVVMYSVSVVDRNKLYELASNFSGEEVPAAMTPEEIDIPDMQLTRAGDFLELRLPGELLFAPGSASLTPDAKDQLQNVLKVLKVTEGPVLVEGHTDDLPIQSEKFPSNWALSAMRSAAIVNYLESDGIAPERLSVVGKGSADPISTNETSEGRANNRRVVFKLNRLDVDMAALSGLEFTKSVSLDGTAMPGVESTGLNAPGSEAESQKTSGQNVKQFDLESVDPELLLQVLQKLQEEESGN